MIDIELFLNEGRMKNFKFAVLFLIIVLILPSAISAKANMAPLNYDYEIINQSPGGNIMQGTGVILWVTIKNTGNQMWYSDNYLAENETAGNPIHLGTVRPTDRNSGFFTPDNWISSNRTQPADEISAEPGEIISFGMYASAPETLNPGTYTECFAPVVENETWLPDHGICWDIMVRENPYQNLDYRAEIGASDANVRIDADAGEVIKVDFQAKNVGEATWYKNGAYPIHVATYKPEDRSSDFYHSSWLSPNRPSGLIEEQVQKGEYGHFSFQMQIPDHLASGSYEENFWLVAENKSWMQAEVKDSATIRFKVYINVSVGDDVDNFEPTEVNVLSLSYIPTNNGEVDTSVMLDVRDNDLDKLRNSITDKQTQLEYSIDQGTRFRAYDNDNAKKALDFRVIDQIEFNKEWPVSNEFFWPDNNHTMIDFDKILTSDVDVCDYVDNQGVKEIWIWGYAAKGDEPKGWETNMSMGYTVRNYWNKDGYGNISNSYRRNDMPICQHTYTVYNNNYGRELGTMLENRTHQIESVLNYVDGRDDTPGYEWGDLLFWGNFVGSDSSGKIVKPGCGWTHYPPNGRSDYDWYNFDSVNSNCADWKPDGGGQEMPVSCTTWAGPSCRENDDGGGEAYKVWWMQSLPGADNGLSYQGRDLKNWWDFIGDFDNQIGDQSLVY